MATRPLNMGLDCCPLVQLRKWVVPTNRARSRAVLVEFPNDADKNTQAANTARLYGLRRKRLYWEFSWIVLS